MNLLTLDILQKLFPSTRSLILTPYVNPLNTTFLKNQFNTINRQAGFLAEVGFESQYFTHVEENLNYSPEGLLKNFGKYFDAQSAANYAHKPINIANRIYANRMGNGYESSGDGWKYHGRGLIQLTGKDNYVLAAKAMGISVDILIDNLVTPEEAINTAVWYWMSNNLHYYCDHDDFTGLTKHTNSGLLGLSQRKEIYDAGKKLIK